MNSQTKTEGPKDAQNQDMHMFSFPLSVSLREKQTKRLVRGYITNVHDGQRSKKRSQNENACSQSVRQFVVVGVVPPLARAVEVPSGVVCVGGLRCLPVDTVVVLLSLRFSPSGGPRVLSDNKVFLGSGRFSHHMFPNVTGGGSHTAGRVRSLAAAKSTTLRDRPGTSACPEEVQQTAGIPTANPCPVILNQCRGKGSVLYRLFPPVCVCGKRKGPCARMCKTKARQKKSTTRHETCTRPDLHHSRHNGTRTKRHSLLLRLVEGGGTADRPKDKPAKQPRNNPSGEPVEAASKTQRHASTADCTTAQRDGLATESAAESVGAPVAAHDGHARRTRELDEKGKKPPALLKASNSKVHAAGVACL